MPLVMVYGHVLDPHVAVVEVTFDNGEMQRETIRDRTFVLNEPAARVGCALRLLDCQRAVIQQIDDLPARLFPALASACPPP